ncbi:MULTISPECIES: hypothetical protein [Thioalkalivibrio]|nr:MULTISPECIES: hypothetical protein [Thioalkalivibrio]
MSDRPPPMPSSRPRAALTLPALILLLAAGSAPAADGADNDTPQATTRADDAPQSPEGRQLVEQRCLNCHGERTLSEAGFGRLGWHATVTRMNWVNGAGVGFGERGPIVDYLSEQSEPSMARVIGEWVVAALLAAGAAFVLWRGIRRWRRRQPTG